jgi:hypothetical protein
MQVAACYTRYVTAVYLITRKDNLQTVQAARQTACALAFSSGCDTSMASTLLV